MHRNRKHPQSERGQSLTELAISLMFILLLLAGAVDLGRAFFSLIALRDAAQEGAVYGSLNPTDNSGIELAVRTNSTTPVDLSDTGNVTVSSNTIGDSCAGNSIQVTVSYDFRLAMPFIGAVLGSQSFPLSATMTDVILLPACP